MNGVSYTRIKNMQIVLYRVSDTCFNTGCQTPATKNIHMQRITLTLETELQTKMRDEAKRDDRSMSSVARIALARHFGIAIKKPAKKKGKA